jgi:hypothetical protein
MILNGGTIAPITALANQAQAISLARVHIYFEGEPAGKGSMGGRGLGGAFFGTAPSESRLTTLQY